MQFDYWLRDDCVGSTNGGEIRLTIARNRLDDYKIEGPSAYESEQLTEPPTVAEARSRPSATSMGPAPTAEERDIDRQKTFWKLSRLHSSWKGCRIPEHYLKVYSS